MKKILIRMFVYLAVFLLAGQAVAGTTAVYLRTPLGSRSLGLGSAYTGLCDDIEAVFWNPSGLAQVKNIQIAFQHFEFVQDIKHEVLSASFPFESGSLAGSFSYISSGELEIRDEAGVNSGSFRPYCLVGQFSCGQFLTQSLMAGLSAKMMYESIYDAHSTAVAFDTGVLWSAGRFKTGAVCLNFGPSVKAGTMPSSFRIGISFNPEDFSVAADLDWPVDRNPGMNLGAEYRFLELISIRAGYACKFSENEAFPAGLSAGLGLSIKGFTLDYGFRHFGWLGLTHLIKIGTVTI